MNSSPTGNPASQPIINNSNPPAPTGMAPQPPQNPPVPSQSSSSLPPQPPSDTFVVKSTPAKKILALNINYRLALPAAIIILLIIVGTGASLFLKQRYSASKAAKTYPSTNPVVSVPPENLVSENEIQNVSEILSPWGYAYDIFSPEPTKPSLEDLEQIYNSLKKAVRERDKTSLANFLAKERLWYFENPKEFKGEAKGGQKVFVQVKTTPPEDNLPELLYLAPDSDEVVATKISEPPPSDPLSAFEGFMLIDKDTNKVEFVSKTPWRYTLVADFETKPEAKKTGKGQVTFVYDQDRWKYLGEIWNLETPAMSNLYGDSLTGNEEKVTELSSADKDLPKILNLKIGEAVVWKNFKGIIYTYQTTAGNWNSPFLLGDQYTKVFDQAGTYYYKIVSPGSPFNGEVHVE